MQDRRKFIRLDAAVDVIYARCDSSQDSGQFYSRNICKGGICFVVNKKLKKSDLIDLKISIPRYLTPIAAMGKVAWIKEAKNSCADSKI